MIAYIDALQYLCFKKGNIIVKVFFYPYYCTSKYSGSMNFCVMRNYFFKSIFLRIGSPRHKKFISIYFNDENLVQLLIKYPERRKFISDMFKKMRKLKR